MNITFYVKSVFGKEYYYPDSDQAKVICKLLKAPTLTLKHLKICKEAGWNVKQKMIPESKAKVDI